jgi:hypothetical protein
MQILVNLDDSVYDVLRSLAVSRNMSESEVIAQFLAKTDATGQEPRSLIGAFSSEPDLIDQACDSAMESRERNVWSNSQESN